MLENFFSNPFPTLDISQTLYLREQRLTDAPDFFEYYANPAVSEQILASTPNTVAEAEAEIQFCRNLFPLKKGAFWSVCLKKTDQMIGSIGFYANLTHNRLEVSYELSEVYWRQGIMSQALNTFNKFAFESIGVSRIEAIILPNNVASAALLSKIGFHFEGLLKHYKWFDGKAHDIHIYSKIRAN